MDTFTLADLLCALVVGIVLGVFLAAAIGGWAERRRNPKTLKYVQDRAWRRAMIQSMRRH